MSTKISILAADSKKFCIFNVKNGKYLSIINIPAHLERSKGKNESDCTYPWRGLDFIAFKENQLIVMFDCERTFPAVLDIYSFGSSQKNQTSQNIPKNFTLDVHS